MPSEGSRRRGKPLEYNVLIVPTIEGGKTRSFRTSGLTALLVFCVCCVLLIALTLVALVYTPLAQHVSIPNPELERKYGREISDTQERLAQLSEDVRVLKMYNGQLRKALGSYNARDTSLAKETTLLRTASMVVPGSSVNDAKRQPPISDAGPGRDPGRAPDLRGVQATVVAPSVPITRLTFPLLPPTEGFISQRFDQSRQHFGIDYAGKKGSPIYAAADGYVVFSGWTYDDGNMLIISHGDRYLTVYKHNQSLFKSAHTLVKRGEVIGVLGTSGHTSLGPHLHFEVWKDGIPSDPEEYMIAVHKIH